MYLSTLFLNKLNNGALYAINKCNEEFLRRFSIYQHTISNFFARDSLGNIIHTNKQGDELMALWDVFKDFKEEIIYENLAVIEVMNEILDVRNGVRAEIEINGLLHQQFL